MTEHAERAPVVVLDGLRVEFLPLRQWPADCAVIMGSSVNYQAGPGSDMPAVLCAVCLDPLRDSAFSVHTLIYPGPCRSGDAHMPAYAVAVHVTCVIPRDGDMTETILSLTADCRP
jgi:hypothetical protein